MKQEHIDLLKETLQQYGADFDGWAVISNNGKRVINIQTEKGRFKYYHAGFSNTVASSPISKAGIEKFVESYWHRSKK